MITTEKNSALKEADRHLISLPIWNYSIPYPMKHFIDVITQPGYTFTVSIEGTRGLIVGKPATVIYASGFAYTPGSALESWHYQKPYIRHWLRFIGFEQIDEVRVDPTLLGQEALQASIDQAKASVSEPIEAM